MIIDGVELTQQDERRINDLADRVWAEDGSILATDARLAMQAIVIRRRVLRDLGIDDPGPKVKHDGGAGQV